ncbi:nuclear transport factor 2 family protein [Ramlibacter rhizophilus]|uniref:Nuclear transport factor 2 family protein n=1 Tax=Ramlibacter rhizophilus TaxID=1781167 RepID=A0A4Z0BH45_9BURK|nr:nuclear transport factor 2 family protein [Ramlibacter rhizophilus]TFY98656.1 nuclear transport factor 2 family protein [Ramlibacter rhizophilus]
MSQQNVTLVQSIYEAFARGDVPAVLALFADDIEWIEADHFPYADGSPYRGPQAVVNGVFARLGAEWDGFSVQPKELLDAGDRVVALGTYRGTYKATGKPVQAQFAHVWSLRAGKAAKFQQYTDTQQFAQAVGAVAEGAHA